LQPNIAIKFAEYVSRILLCKHCKFGEKISTISKISNFSHGLILWRAMYIRCAHVNKSLELNFMAHLVRQYRLPMLQSPEV